MLNWTRCEEKPNFDRFWKNEENLKIFTFWSDERKPTL